jgi:hypothetical protein
MDWKGFFKRRGYSWRIQDYITRLEARHDELPAGYEDERAEFDAAFKSFIRARTFYIAATLLFYASIVTSVTASVGFRINVFEQVYGVLGFSTVALLYLFTRYNMRLSRADLQNTRSRLISFLTAHEPGTAPPEPSDENS